MDLHARVLGEFVAPEGPEVDASLALLEGLRAVSTDDEAAWTHLLTAMFQDIRVAYD